MLLASALSFPLGMSRPQRATGAETPVWMSKGDVRAALDSQLGLQWKQVPVRDGLANICRDQPFFIWLDRRIDPGLRIDFSARDERFEVTLLRLCEQQKWGLATLGPVIYLGPKTPAERLATVAALRRFELSRQSGNGARLNSSVKPLAWPELSSPRDLAVKVAAECGLEIENPEVIPHDLWPARELPAMSAADRLTLLLCGFDLTFQATSQSIKIRPISTEENEMEITHVKAGDITQALNEIKRMFPDTPVSREGNRLVVKGSYEIQEKVERLLRGEQIRNVKVGLPTTRYTLAVDSQPAGAVVKTVATQLNREAKYSDEVREKLQTLVTFQVKNVTIDELLSEALRPVGLRYKLTEKTLEIEQADE